MKKCKKKRKEFNLNGYIFGALRKIDRWHPGRKEVLTRSLVRYETKEVFRPREGKLVKIKITVSFHKCENCMNVFPRKEVHVDHIIPVVDPKKGFETWDIYIKRLYVDADKRQILCKKDHHTKTQKENKIRRKIK